MQALMTAIVTWLSVNFGLPADYHHPLVKFVPPAEIASLRNSAPRTGRPAAHHLLAPGFADDVIAVYDDRGSAILLQVAWTGVTPAELSILVHEMVHHLQDRAGAAFACPAERERLAYAAQDKWLGLFGKSLETEFGIDAMTLLVRTTCAY
jgi:hypothetical protein